MSIQMNFFRNNLQNHLKNCSPLLSTIRNGHVMRGKPPGVARSLEQRLRDENPVDPEIAARVNIGFPKIKPARSLELKERLAQIKAQRSNSELEKKARSGELLIDLEQVQKDSEKTTGQYQLRDIADHYGVFEHLFGDAYFVPRVSLDIKYNVGTDVLCPVYNGNIIKPKEASQEPIVNFDGTTDPITGKQLSGETYWTLIATNPDGQLAGNEQECVHWFISNIPNGKVKDGEVIVPYLQPFPPKGLGYQRFIFVLYKQEKKLNFDDYKVKSKTDLQQRSFKTVDFYRKFQDDITPAGLAFFQSDWDKSLTKFYHEVLDTKEPIFEYDFPKAYRTDQRWFPLKQPFNLYMDRYRDPKQVNLEYLEKKLEKTHPFEGPEPPLRYPNAHPIKGVPSWLRTEIKKNRLGIGRINDY